MTATPIQQTYTDEPNSTHGSRVTVTWISPNQPVIEQNISIRVEPTSIDTENTADTNDTNDTNHLPFNFIVNHTVLKKFINTLQELGDRFANTNIEIHLTWQNPKSSDYNTPIISITHTDNKMSVQFDLRQYVMIVLRSLHVANPTNLQLDLLLQLVQKRLNYELYEVITNHFMPYKYLTETELRSIRNSRRNNILSIHESIKDTIELVPNQNYDAVIENLYQNMLEQIEIERKNLRRFGINI